MKLTIRAKAAVSLLAFAALLTLVATPASAQRGGFGLDPRAEDRTYRFADTDEDMQYCVFASSRISDDTPAPLIISLHGLGAGPQIMCNSTAVDLAEEGGYIFAAPMGYNTGGWYGSPTLGGGGRGRGRGGNNAAPALSFDAIDTAGDDDQLTADEVGEFFGNIGNGPGGGDFAAQAFGRWDANDDGMVTRQEFDDRPQFGGGGFGGGNQPENLSELSEKDVMNVLAMMREEFNVDDGRIYLTGHSMGGAGTLFLGSKHADIWAAIAPVAPAAFSMTDNREDVLQGLNDGGVPVLIVHGDEDEAVPVDLARTWVATMEELDMEHEYEELPGVTHGPVITVSQEYVYAFFDKHSR
jgi:poly(3-hydroxybutyrate) depolymerase